MSSNFYFQNNKINTQEVECNIMHSKKEILLTSFIYFQSFNCIHIQSFIYLLSLFLHFWKFYTYLCRYIRMHIYMCVYMCVCMHTCIHTYICVYVCLYLYVCVCVCIHGSGIFLNLDMNNRKLDFTKNHDSFTGFEFW